MPLPGLARMQKKSFTGPKGAGEAL